MLQAAGTRAGRWAAAAADLASIYLDDPLATAAERQRIPELVGEIAKSPQHAALAVWIEVRGRRLGIGWDKDEMDHLFVRDKS